MTAFSCASGSGPHVALVTCAAYAELDVDDRDLIPALRAQGVAPRIAIWNDPQVPWHQCDYVILRSTWDYSQDLQAFLAWAGSLQGVTTLANSLEIIEWSADKHYLGDLASAGVPVVDTQFIEPGDRYALPSRQFVVKPTVSAGSRNTYRFSPDRIAEAALSINDIHALGKTVMIQPYLESVDTSAETAMVFFDGSFSHAARKGALLGLDDQDHNYENGLFIREHVTAREPRPDQLEVARAALGCAPSGWLYARVDL
ncbi:MAG: hypothetical protein WC005_05190, partial [Candidatus Nanopelagicales bacterium]